MKLEKRLEHFLKYVDKHTYWKDDNDVPNHVIVRAYMQKFKPTENKHSVMQGCQCKDRIGETKVWCCNQCGLPCQDFWLPTHYTVGSRTVGKAGEDASVSDGK